jgi:transposase
MERTGHNSDGRCARREMRRIHAIGLVARQRFDMRRIQQNHTAASRRRCSHRRALNAIPPEPVA